MIDFKANEFKINRFRLAIGFIIVGLTTIFFPRLAREIITYWVVLKKLINKGNQNEQY